MSQRKLVGFNMTRADIPADPQWDHGTPYCASMANEDLRVTHHGDDRRFLPTLVLACQMIEQANPDAYAAMVDHDVDKDGHVRALTVTVIKV